MQELRELQHQFMDYLLNNSDERIAVHVTSSAGRPAKQRLGFYAHAYRARLKETLESDYKCLHSYLGDKLFKLLAKEYIAACPSNKTSLRDFGARIPAFLANTAPFDQWHEVVEIATIEKTFAHSFDAADTAVLTQAQLSKLDPQEWVELRLHFHASLHLIPLQWNSFEIWQALSEDKKPPKKIRQKSVWLIWRRDLVSHYRSLDRPEMAALELALSGECFADICSSLTDYFSEQSTAQHALTFLQQWLYDGMISEFKT